MPQNYKVFFYDNILILGNRNNLTETITLVHKFESGEKLRLLLFRFLKGKTGEKVLIESEDVGQLWKEFCGLFVVREAAGGLVYNKKKQWLFIKRNGLYDLPKGHIEPGELIETTAVREVQEECNLEKLQIEQFLITTYHVYHTKSKIILKPSHWFLMKHLSNEKPAPQLKENITEAFFTDAKNIPSFIPTIYPSIMDVLKLKFTL